MATRPKSRPGRDAIQKPKELPIIPSPAKVLASAEEIRREWTPRQRRRRAQVARYLLLQQLLARVE